MIHEAYAGTIGWKPMSDVGKAYGTWLGATKLIGLMTQGSLEIKER